MKYESKILQEAKQILRTGIDPSIWSKKPRLHTWPILGLAGVGSKLEPAAGLGITWVPLCARRKSQ